jgi:glycosyltransferase involved in cell wall biosynthesis
MTTASSANTKGHEDLPVVCHIITKLELGGAQEVALFTLAHLERARYRPALITGPGGLLMDDARSLGDVEIMIADRLDRPIRPLQDLLALMQLIRLLRQVRPAIVHTHSSKAGILGRWAAWFAGVRVIVHTVHGYGVTPDQPRWMRRLLLTVERITGLITSHWVAVAQINLKEGIRWGLFDCRNASHIPPGIDPRVFQVRRSAGDRNRLRTELGANSGEHLVGMVACLKPQKAPQDFVEVAARVCARMPSVQFVLIGDGELRESVEEHIRTAGLAARVRLVGWRRDIPAVMHALDLLLLTSHWEGLARVLLEARAAGTPVVATRVGGAAEAVMDAHHGWLCEKGDVENLASRVCEVLRADRAGPSAPFPEEFDIRQMLKQYQNLYDKLLTGPISQDVRLARQSPA